MKAFLPVALFFSASLAHADVCLSIAEDRDTLDEVDRKGVLTLARASFEDAGEKVVDPPCSDHYKLSNVRLGNSVSASISGPKGERKGQARSIEDLGNVYDQLIRSLVKGVPVESAMTRSNVTEKQANPNRAKADSLYVVRIGTGYVVGSDLGEIPIALGGGWRYELDSFAIEAGFDLTLALSDKSEDTSGLHFGGFIGGLYFFDDQGDSSPYVGGGLGYGFTGLISTQEEFSGGGLEGKLSAGWAFFRASTIRAVIQFDATLPFYDVEEDFGGDGSKYAPIFGLSLGVGYNPN